MCIFIRSKCWIFVDPVTYTCTYIHVHVPYIFLKCVQSCLFVAPWVASLYYSLLFHNCQSACKESFQLRLKYLLCNSFDLHWEIDCVWMTFCTSNMYLTQTHIHTHTHVHACAHTHIHTHMHTHTHSILQVDST